MLRRGPKIEWFVRISEKKNATAKNRVDALSDAKTHALELQEKSGKNERVEVYFTRNDSEKKLYATVIASGAVVYSGLRPSDQTEDERLAAMTRYSEDGVAAE